MAIWEAIGGFVEGLGRTAVDLIEQFHLSPEDKVKFKEAMFNAQMKARNDLWALEDADRANARKRETETGDPTTRRLAWLYTGGYFAIFVLLISGVFHIDDSIKQLVDVLMAVLTAGQYSILAYYFGSSHGSAKKDETLDRVVNHKDPAVAK